MKRFAGIDIGSERHVVAVLDEHGAVMIKTSPFGEEAARVSAAGSCSARRRAV